MPVKFSRITAQQGQAMVFVVLFLGVVSLSLVFLYKAGKITSEKMQVQNAADAAAYSVSVTEARDLNFMSYTNRAMVANEVAIGQMVGMASWATHWESFGYYLMAYHRLFIQPLISAASLGTATAPVETIFTTVSNVGFNVPGKLFFNIFKVVANIGAIVLHNINKAYSYAQTGYHFVSILYGVSAYVDLVEDNAPGAKISDFGILSLIGHATTYGSIPGIPGSFTKTYRPTTATSASDPPDPTAVGYERLAATINGSRDEFTRYRGWTLPLTIPGVFPINIDYTGDDRFEIDLGLATLFLELQFVLRLDLEKEGASELRYVGDAAQGNKFNWSAADTTELALTLHFFIRAGADTPLGEVAASVTVGLGDGEAYGALELPVIGELFSFSLPFPTGAPFSSGAAQAGKLTAGANRNMLNQTDLATVSTDSYGGSPSNRASWLIGAPFVPGPGPVFVAPNVPVVSLTMPTPQRQVSRSYGGLPMYTDTIPQGSPWGFEAPYFLAGVVKDSEVIYSKNAPLKTIGDGPVISSSNTFYLDDDAIADSEVAAIAKSEVYYKRPQDLDYFRREDDHEEYGSAFNPYWQARLVETTYADRTVSMLIQQKQAFGLLSTLVNLTVPLDPTNWLPGYP
jgi:hypothetical protein